MRPEARKKARERAQKICRKYQTIPKSVLRERHKNDWRFCNRVGRSANERKKISQGKSNLTVPFYNSMNNFTGNIVDDWIKMY